MYQITSRQRHEIEAARTKNRNMRVELKLKVLCLHASGLSLERISELSGYAPSSVNQIIRQYVRFGLDFMLENHYRGNNRNMSFEDERALLAGFEEKRKQGQSVSVKDIAREYQKKVPHEVSPKTIYALLKRHNWNEKLQCSVL